MNPPPPADDLAQWLLGGVQWNTTVFHVGQYCGRWRASTAGQGQASFHAVLRGACYLHRPNQAPMRLQEGDAVFLLHDAPHHLCASAEPMAPGAHASMGPTWPVASDGTSLACGFFQFTGPLRHWLTSAWAEPLVLRHGTSDPDLRQAANVFAMMRDEADRSACGFSDAPGDQPSPLLARLAGLLFHYVLRHTLCHDGALAQQAGLWALARHPALAPLLHQWLAAPGDPWTIAQMARTVHMSRARFCRLFSATCGDSPAQFLLRVRMQEAAQRLRHGDSLTRTAERVGFQSQAAFTRAFTRVLGERPGTYQRGGAHGVRQPLPAH